MCQKYGMDPDQEFAAGWIDGSRAAGVEIRNHVRRELVRYGQELGADDVVRPCERPDATPRKVPAPDNPLGDASYLAGWTSGHAAGLESIVRHLRQNAVASDLYVTRRGQLATVGLVDDLVHWFRAATEADERTGVMTDASLHAFIDGTDSTAPPPPPPQPHATPSDPESRTRACSSTRVTAPHATTTRSCGSRLKGFWTMVRRNIDRRTAIATLAGVIAGAGGLGWLWWGGETLEVQKPIERTQVPSDLLQGLPEGLTAHSPSASATFFSIHAAIRTTQSNGGIRAVKSLLTQVMATPGEADALKMYVSTYITEMGRFDLLPPLLTGLIPSHSDTRARRGILTSVLALATRDAKRVPESVKPALVLYDKGGYESDSTNQQLLTAALQRLR